MARLITGSDEVVKFKSLDLMHWREKKKRSRNSGCGELNANANRPHAAAGLVRAPCLLSFVVFCFLFKM